MPASPQGSVITPNNKLMWNLPIMSPAESSTKTPITSNTSGKKKRSNHLVRPSTGVHSTTGSTGRKSASPANIPQAPRVVVNRKVVNNNSSSSSSPFITTTQQFNFDNIIKTKNSEDPPPSDLSLESNKYNHKRTEQEPEGSHISRHPTARSSSPTKRQTSPKQATNRPILQTNISTKEQSVETNNKEYIRKIPRAQPRFEPPHDSREDINSPKSSPQRSSSASPWHERQSQSPKKVIRSTFSDDDRYVSDEKRKQQGSYRTVDNIENRGNKSPRRDNNIKSRKDVDREYNTSTHSNHSMMTHSVETYHTNIPFPKRDPADESESIFDRTVAHCGDVIYATVAGVANATEVKLRHTDDHGQVIAEIVPNVSDVTGSTQLTEKLLRNGEENSCSSSWWISMFQRLKKEHENELKQFKDDLDVAKERKLAYKAELKSSLASQLTWLESQMMTTNYSATENPARGKGGAVNVDTKQRQFRSFSSQDGVEVTMDNSVQMKRILHLEQILQDTIEQHAIDRQQWYTALEEAAAVTATGEKLSLKQQEQLTAIRKEAQEASTRQRLQWKEKTRVLTEILELTEQQHRQEISEWTVERERLTKRISTLCNEKNELALEFDRVLSDMQELTDDADLAFKEAASQKEQAASALKLCNGFEEQASAALKEAEDFKNQAFKTQSEKNEIKKQLEEIMKQKEGLLSSLEASEKRATERKEDVDKAALEIEALRAERNSLISSKEQSNKELIRLHDVLSKIQHDQRDAKEQASNALKLCSDYEAQMDITVKDTIQWQKQIEDAMVECKFLKDENDKLTAETNTIKNQYNALKVENDSTKVTLVSAQNELSTIQSSMEQQRISSEQHQRMADTVRTENEALKEALNQQSAKLDDLKKIHEAECESLRKENTRFKDQIAIKVQEMNLAHKEIDLFKTEVETIQSELDSSTKLLTSTKSEVSGLKTEVETLNERLKETGNELVTVQTEVKVISLENDIKEKQVKKLQNDIEASRKESAADGLKVLAAKRETDKLKREIKDLRKQAADFTEQALSSQKQCLKLQRNLAAASPRDANGRIRNRNVVPSKFSPTNQEWEDKLDTAVAERDLYKQESHNLSQTLQQTTDELDVCQQDLKVAQKELADTNDSMAQIHMENKKSRDACEQLKAQRDVFEKQALETEDRLDSLRKELSEIQQQWRQQTEQDLKKQLVKITAIESERDLYKKQAIEAAEASRRARAKLRKSYDSSTSTHDENEQLDSTHMQLIELRNEELSRKYQESIVQMNDAENRLKVAELQRSNERGSWKLQLEAALAEIRKLIDEKGSMQMQLAKLQQFMKKEGHGMTEFVVPVDLSDSHDIHDISVANRELSEQLQIVEFPDKQRFNTLFQEHHQKLVKLDEQSGGIHSVDSVLSYHDRFPHDTTRDESYSTKGEISKPREEWKRHTQENHEPSRRLLVENEELKVDLEQTKLSHAKAKSRLDFALSEIESYKQEISLLQRKIISSRSDSSDCTTQQDLMIELGQNQKNFTNSVQKLQEDIQSLKDHVDSPGLNIKDSIHQLQLTFQDLFSDLGSEVKAVRRFQQTMQEFTRDATSTNSSNDSPRRDPQGWLVEEVGQIRNLLLQAVEGDTGSRNAATIELVEELKRKEVALADAKQEIDEIREKLDTERTLREKSECRNASLKAQVVVYSEELVNLQTANSKLLDRFDYRSDSFVDTEMYSYDDYEYVKSKSRSKEDTLPLLDEALALAEGFTDIINGKDPTALEMLESLSDMMERHDTSGRKKMIAAGRDESPSNKSSSDYINVIQTDTPPKDTINQSQSRPSLGGIFRSTGPPRRRSSNPTQQSTPLQLLVEQLFGRCEMLERERIRLMEITLDLIESSASATESQLSEALEVARRRSVEEMMKLKDQSKVEQERIFKKICTRCIKMSQSVRTV